jgi:hypothetical protein
MQQNNKVTLKSRPSHWYIWLQPHYHHRLGDGSEGGKLNLPDLPKKSNIKIRQGSRFNNNQLFPFGIQLLAPLLVLGLRYLGLHYSSRHMHTE